MQSRFFGLVALGLLIPGALLASDGPAPVVVYGPPVILDGYAPRYLPYPVVYRPIGPYHPYVPYQTWGSPYHWIYGYLPPDLSHTRYGYDHRRYNEDVGEGKAYRGRKDLYPAVPFSDYEKDQRTAPVETLTVPKAATDRALLEIHLPLENAKLWFDNQEAKGEGKVRLFQTPPLKVGETYRFTIKGDWEGGFLQDNIVIEEQVTFRAGEHKVIELKRKK